MAGSHLTADDMAPRWAITEESIAAALATRQVRAMLDPDAKAPSGAQDIPMRQAEYDDVVEALRQNLGSTFTSEEDFRSIFVCLEGGGFGIRESLIRAVSAAIGWVPDTPITPVVPTFNPARAAAPTSAVSRDPLTMPPGVAEGLGPWYVYLLRDPRDGRVFYVGKGTGARVFSHAAFVRSGQRDPEMDAARDSDKIMTIRAIQGVGLEVEHLIVRSGIQEEDTAFMVEQAVIDAYRADGRALASARQKAVEGNPSLTNKVLGHHARTLGFRTVDDAVAELAAEPAPPLPIGSLVVIINTWRPGMSDADIFDLAHGHWVLGRSTRQRARWVFAVARGVIRGSYRVDAWYRSPNPGDSHRWGFVGSRDPLLDAYQGTHLVDVLGPAGRGAANPVRTYLEGTV